MTDYREPKGEDDVFTRTKTDSKSPTAIRVSQTAPCQQRLQIQLSTAAIQPVRDVVLKEFQREAVIAGFRKGKAPQDLVERRYVSEIREETLRRLTRQVFEQATTEHQLKPVGPFEVTKMEFDEATRLELEANVEVEPEFPLADYRGMRLAQPPVTVTTADIEQALTQLQESAAELVPTEDGTDKAKRIPTLDDAFAKDVGFEDLTKLRAHLEAKLQEQKRAQRSHVLEQALCDELLARHQFEVPPRLVEKQAERLMRDVQARLLMSGTPEEKLNEELQKYTERLKTNAVRLVKLNFILERIAEREKLSLTQDEVVDRLWTLAKRWGKDPAEVKRLLDAQGLWNSVLSSIRQDKTVAWLLSVAYVEAESSA